MIKNGRQYRITKAQAARFEAALKVLAESPSRRDTHPLIRKAEEEALRSQLNDLEAALAEYEELRSVPSKALELGSFEELPRSLIRARIAKGMSQKELAERLGVKEQQVQRYESTDYMTASLGRIREIIRAFGLESSEGLLVEDEDASLAKLFRRLREVGIDRDLVVGRLASESASGIEDQSVSDGTLAFRIASVVGRVFGWTTREIFGNKQLLVQPVFEATRFKLPKKVNPQRLLAYSVYAHYIALLVLDCTRCMEQREVVRDARNLRAELTGRYHSVTFDALLEYVWDLGIPVVPLNDPGAFHGACWKFDGRNVIVLKQRSRSPSVWLFDLLHELWHSGEEPKSGQWGAIDVEGADKENSEEAQEEAAAWQFAGDVILDGRSEELAKMCVEEASGRVERLKRAVPLIAKRESVEVDALANYMAFRLSLQGINWWGSAQSLQRQGERPWLHARDKLMSHVEFTCLSEPDRELVMAALRERDESLEVT